MPIARLTDRAVLHVAGADSANFLAGLVTCAVDGAAAHYGGLLTPQGKIIADFFLALGQPGQGGFLIDAPRLVADSLLKRLSMYKLRAKVALADLSADLGVFAAWATAAPAPASPDIARFTDPRLAQMGQRLIGPIAALAPLGDASPADYDLHRIGLAIPQGGRDFAYGDAFPHEACMDQLGGVDFEKGCYVGQEVVSRTQHRASARTRVAALSFAGSSLPEQAEIKAGGKVIGRVGSVDATHGRAIALLRLDRLADALAAGHSLRADEVSLRAEKPGWARYDFPDYAAQER